MDARLQSNEQELKYHAAFENMLEILKSIRVWFINVPLPIPDRDRLVNLLDQQITLSEESKLYWKKEDNANNS